MQELLRHVFESLEHANIKYCLLRGYEELDQLEKDGDVDLLVQEDQLEQLANILAQLDFVSLPAWGREPHRFFVAYDLALDCWLKLDLVTTVAFGNPIHAIHTDLATTSLARRRRREPTYLLSPEDELITLLLHCVLDKGEFKPNRRARIQVLRTEISDVGHLADMLRTYWSPQMTWSRLATLIDEMRWAEMLAQRAAVVRQLAHRQHLRVFGRRVRGRVLRKLDRVAGMLQPRSLSVALLAPDGGGKTTLANALTRTFYLPSRYIYMGTSVEASTVGLPTTRWMAEQSRTPRSTGQLPAWVVARGMRFANNVFEQWYRYMVSYYHMGRGRLVLFDRYVYDSQLRPSGKTSLKSRVRRWLLSAAAPKPDLVVFLDAPGEVLYARKGEHSPAVLEQQRQHYLKLQKHIPQMVVVDATRDAEDVRRIVTSIIWQGYANHLQRG